MTDIDFGDQRLNRFAGATNTDEVVANLKDSHLLKEEVWWWFNEFDFDSQSYRIYRTHSGCRVICTSVPVPWDREPEWFLRFLRSDPEYIKLCDIQRCYRARLTPKPWREKRGPTHVCILEGVHGDGKVHDDLAEQLRLHDELTLAEGEQSSLA